MVVLLGIPGTMSTHSCKEREQQGTPSPGRMARPHAHSHAAAARHARLLSRARLPRARNCTIGPTQ